MRFKPGVNMMKKFIVLLVVFININYFCNAQDANSKKIDSLQIEYFNKELELSQEESDKFWPVYNTYKNEIKNTRKESESDPIVLEEKILNIRKKYRGDFKKILESEDRVNKVYVLEKSFRDMLRDELLKRQSKDEEGKDSDDE